MEFYPALKVLSMIATGVFGVIGALGNDKESEAEKNKRKKVAIIGVLISAGLSIALYGMEALQAKKSGDEAKEQYGETKRKLDLALTDSDHLMKVQQASLDKARALEKELTDATTQNLAAINTASQEMASKQAATLRAQRIAIASQDQIRLWQFRGSFPLLPLTISYKKLYVLVNSRLQSYGMGLDAASKKVTIGDPRFLDLLLGLVYPLTEEEKPGRLYPELTRDIMRFRLSGSQADGEIDFKCTQQTGDYSFDQRRHLLYKTVTCKDLFPDTRDSLAISALDLVGRTLTWKGTTRLPPYALKYLVHDGEMEVPSDDWKLLTVVFTFPYSKEYQRSINVPDGASKIILTSKSLGLDGIFDSRPRHTKP